MEGIAVEGQAQRHGTGKRRNKRHFGLGGQGQGGNAGGGAYVGKQGGDVGLQQLAGVFFAAGGLITVIQIADFYLPSANAALGVELVEIQLGPRMELNAQLRGRARKGGRLAQHNFVGLGVHSRKAGQCGGTSGERELAAVEHGQILRQDGDSRCRRQPPVTT